MTPQRRTGGRRPAGPKERKAVLVLCEGETEVAYLKGLRERYSGFRLEVRQAKSTDALRIVKEATRCAADGFHQVWAVFDTEGEDVTPAEECAQDFNRTAKDVSVCIAVSHPDFEVWLLLHHRKAEDVKKCCRTGEAALMLQQVLPGWQKGEWDRRRRRGTRFEDFAERVEDACRRADRLGRFHTTNLPSTNVGMLVRAKEDGFRALP
ncbi:MULTISPECIES: RloB family protein [Streptomonospora]|uniref:RloB family protein n=2 Tax=Streptomonospora TaxID=104204 RepID=A0ABV9SQ41_9ACTN